MNAPEEDFSEIVFKWGTGHLGWSPETTLNTPIPQIILALEGKYDFAIKTNPFGGGKQESKRTPEERAAFIKSQRTELAMIKAEFKAKAKGKDGNSD